MSVIIGGYIIGIVVMPDLTRYAKSARHGMFAAVLSMLIALPLVLLSAAIACVATGEKNLVALMIGLGIGLPAMVLLTFATWTSNAVNLYSSSLSLAAIVPRIAKWKLVILAGILGTLAAVFSFATYFIPFLVTIGVALPPVAGIYIADFYFVQRQRYNLDRVGSVNRIDVSAMSAWITGSAVGLLTTKGAITMTGISGCDSLMVALGYLPCWKKNSVQVLSNNSDGIGLISSIAGEIPVRLWRLNRDNMPLQQLKRIIPEMADEKVIEATVSETGESAYAVAITVNGHHIKGDETRSLRRRQSWAPPLMISCSPHWANAR